MDVYPLEVILREFNGSWMKVSADLQVSERTGLIQRAALTLSAFLRPLFFF